MSVEIMKPLEKELIPTKFGLVENFDITQHTDYRSFVEVWNYVTDIPFQRSMVVVIPSKGSRKLSYEIVPLTKTAVTAAFRDYLKHTDIPFVVNPHMGNRRLFKTDDCAIFVGEFVDNFMAKAKAALENPQIDIDDEDINETEKVNL